MSNGFDAPRVIRGRRYAGMAQDSYDYYLNEGLDRLVDRAKKFLSEEKSHHKRAKVNRSVTRVARNIQWVMKRRKASKMVNSSHLAEVVMKLMTSRVSPYNALYRVFRNALCDEKIPPLLRIPIVATGVDPEKKREMGTFIKVKVLEEEFALPNSFFRECSSAFVKNILVLRVI